MACRLIQNYWEAQLPEDFESRIERLDGLDRQQQLDELDKMISELEELLRS